MTGEGYRAVIGFSAVWVAAMLTVVTFHLQDIRDELRKRKERP